MEKVRWRVRFVAVLWLLSLVWILSSIPASIPAAAQEGSSCAVTPQTAERPGEPNIAAWSRYWYRSGDGQLWASGFAWYADGWKVGWRKPENSRLEVSGRRLDGEAPPLTASIPSGYDGTFQSSALIFPTAGCWQVEAQAASSSLKIVVYVYPKAYKDNAPGIACEDVAKTVRQSSLILLAQAEGRTADRFPEFTWSTVRVLETWKGTVRSGERLEVLQQTAYDHVMELGQTYLLFLWAQPGYHLRALCPTTAEVREDRVVINRSRETIWSQQPPAWDGKQVQDVAAQFKALLDTGQ